MFKLFENIWKTIARLEEVYAVITLVITIVPVAVGVVLAASAKQQGWVVWLVAFIIFGAFTAGRYYFAKYRSEFGLSGNITLLFGGLTIEGDADNENNCTKRLNVVIKNTASFPIAVCVKYKFSIDGRTTEDEDFDIPVFIGANQVRYLATDPVKKVSFDAEDWRCTLTCRYGVTIEKLKYEVTMRAKSDPPTGYITEDFKETSI